MKSYASYRFLRDRWYYQVDRQQRSVKEVCEIFGVSRKTYYQWRARDLGPKQGYSARLAHPHLKLTPEVRTFIEKEKLRTNYGPLKMKFLVKRELKIDLSTTLIYRFYQRKNLIRKKQKKLPWYQPIKERIFTSKPGENVEFDVQYLWQSKFIYRFRLVDEFSRMQFFADSGSKDSQSAVRIFEQAQKYFPFQSWASRLTMALNSGASFINTFWRTRSSITSFPKPLLPGMARWKELMAP